LSGYERKLTQRGIKYRVAQVPETRQIQLFFHDPAGNGVELNFAGTGA
jgi:catechol-2,3-dioxygenase